MWSHPAEPHSDTISNNSVQLYTVTSLKESMALGRKITRNIIFAVTREARVRRENTGVINWCSSNWNLRRQGARKTSQIQRTDPPESG